jgi:hypothetical protein
MALATLIPRFAVASNWVRILEAEAENQNLYPGDFMVLPGGKIAFVGLLREAYEIDPEGQPYMDWYQVSGILSPDGEVNLARSYYRHSRYLCSIDSTPDGNFIITGHTQSGDLFDGIVPRLSSGGQIIWNRAYQAPHRSYFVGCKVTSTGDILLEGTWVVPPYDATLYHELPSLVKLDQNGNQQWHKTMGESEGVAGSRVQTITETSEGDYVVAIRTDYTGTVIRLRPDGSVVWSRQLANWSVPPSCIQSTPDDGVLVSGYAFTLDGYQSRLVKLTSTASVDWAVRYEDQEFSDLSPNPLIIREISEAKSGNHILTATRLTGHQQMYVWEIDSDGNILWQRKLSVDGWTIERPFAARSGSDVVVAAALYSQVDERSGALIAKQSTTGEIEDSECDVVRESLLQDTHRDQAVVDVEVNLEDLSWETPAVDVDPGSFATTNAIVCRGDLTNVDPRTPERFKLHGLPFIVCFEPPETPGAPGGGRGWDSHLYLRRCNPDPWCPDCVVSLVDGNKAMANPKWRAKLWEEIIPFLSNPTNVPVADVDQFVHALESVPLGQHFVEETRDLVLGELKKGQRTKSKALGTTVTFPQDACVTCYLSYALNQIDLDLVVPEVSSQVLNTGEKSGFGGALWLTPRSTSPKQLVTMEVIGDAPSRVNGYRPGWPVAVYRLSAERNDVSKERYSIDVYYGGMYFQGIEDQLRLVQWADGEYADITTWTDKAAKVIHGSAIGLGSFAVLEKRLRKKEIWYR